VNKHGMPVSMLITQAIIVSIIGLLFFYLPDINSSFWILLVLASQLYLLMYLLMFISAIILRYKKPDVERRYKIPGGKFGIWFVSGIGILGAIGTIIVGFFPPELASVSPRFYISFLAIGLIIGCSMPFIILLFKKPSWNEINREKS